MDWQTVLTPWNSGGVVCGLLLGLAVIVSLALNRRQVAAALARIAQRLFSPVGFFGVVIVIPPRSSRCAHPGPRWSFLCSSWCSA